MIDRLTILFITLFCIGSSFFVGYYFGVNISEWKLENSKHDLQISIRTHGNSMDIEKSSPDIRVIINGAVISGTGSVEIKK